VIFPDQAVRIVIAPTPVDFRKWHDGLAAMAHARLGFAPKAGVMVVFRSKRCDRIKVLFWDGRVLLHKSADGWGSPFPGRTYPAAFVTGIPSAVQPFRTAMRTLSSAT